MVREKVSIYCRPAEVHLTTKSRKLLASRINGYSGFQGRYFQDGHNVDSAKFPFKKNRASVSQSTD